MNLMKIVFEERSKLNDIKPMGLHFDDPMY